MFVHTEKGLVFHRSQIKNDTSLDTELEQKFLYILDRFCVIKGNKSASVNTSTGQTNIFTNCNLTPCCYLNHFLKRNTYYIHTWFDTQNVFPCILSAVRAGPQTCDFMLTATFSDTMNFFWSFYYQLKDHDICLTYSDQKRNRKVPKLCVVGLPALTQYLWTCF